MRSSILRVTIGVSLYVFELQGINYYFDIIKSGMALSRAHVVVLVVIESSLCTVDCALGTKDVLDQYDAK